MTLAEIVILAMAYASQLTGYPQPTEGRLSIEFVPLLEMQEQVCPETLDCKVRGTYNTGKIKLHEDIDLINDPFHRSVLVHEMVHHLQHVHKIKAVGNVCDCKCHNRREIEAYGIQNAYLTLVEEVDTLVRYRDDACER